MYNANVAAINAENNTASETETDNSKKYMSIEDFTNTESPVWNNVEYEDVNTQNNITQQIHNEMVSSGNVVVVPMETMEKVSESYPDLRGMKKKDRTELLKDSIKSLKNNIRQFLSGLRNQNFEFDVNGNILEAKIFARGIGEVSENLTQKKSNMLYSTVEIFRNARYLYSTPSYDSDPNIYRWNYFYTPVQIGNETVGVRIAIRDLANPSESQIYHWGIKKDVLLDDEGRGTNDRIPHGVSSSTSIKSISQPVTSVKSDTVETLDVDTMAQEAEFTPEPAHNDASEKNTSLLRGNAFSDTTVLPTAEQYMRDNKAAQAETRLEETGYLLGVDEQIISDVLDISKKLHRDIEFVYSKDTGDECWFDRDSEKICINVNSDNFTSDYIGILVHDITHTIEGTKGYGKLYNMVMKKYSFSQLEEQRTEWSGRYDARGKKISGEAANREIVADYVRHNLFTDKNAITEAVKIDRSFGTTMKGILDRMLSLFGNKNARERVFLARARRYYAEALNQSGTVARSESNTDMDYEYTEQHSYTNQLNIRHEIQDEITQKYQSTVDAVINGTYTDDSAILVGYTPKIYEDLGMPSLPFVIGSGHIYSIAKSEIEAKKENKYNPKTNYHGLGVDAVKNIYEAIQEPIMIISSKDVDKKATPMRSTHSIVSIIDIGKSDKHLLIPIEITAIRTVNGTQMDVNVLSSVYEKTISNLVKEAMALESIGDVGIYYIKKGVTTIADSGVQFPVHLNKRITPIGIIHLFSEKVNMNIQSVTQSIQFKKWFGDWQNEAQNASKAVNNDNSPLVLYHQTAEDISVFDTRHKGAGTYDGETPFGVYLKPTPDDIGLSGNKQIPLYARILNPLVAQNRVELVNLVKKMSPEYADIYNQRKRLDIEYSKKVDNIGEEINQYMSVWRKDNPTASRTALYDDTKYNELSLEEDRLIEEWSSKGEKLDFKMKEILTETIVSNGFDGVHLIEDTGSFGRKTETWIALNNNQVKSATDNIGTFSEDDTNIYHSYSNAAPVTSSTPVIDSTPKVVQSNISRTEAAHRNDIGNIFAIPANHRKMQISEPMHTISEEYMREGTVSEETIQKVFDSLCDVYEIDTPILQEKQVHLNCTCFINTYSNIP